MKKVGDLLTALGAVGFIAVILELIIGWGMLPKSIILWFIIGGLILLIIGLILRNSSKEKSNGKDMKEVEIAMLICGIVLLVITFAGMFSSDTESTLYQFVNDRFGLLFLVIGIILKSIGKSKESKSQKN